MPPYRIELTESAKADLAYYRAFEQGLIVSQIKEQLRHAPLRETRNRKMLRDSISEADDFDAEIEALRNSRRFRGVPPPRVSADVRRIKGGEPNEKLHGRN